MPIYITTKLAPQYEQMTLDEFLFGEYVEPKQIRCGVAGTKTYCVEAISQRVLDRIDVQSMIEALRQFNRKYEKLRTVDRHSLYHTFFIPKKSGGLRKIDAPNEELMAALRELKLILEEKLHAMYHTSAYAYIKKRSTLRAIERHQKNESKWFAKLDLSNFFGSTTLEFVIHMFSMIFPFCLVISDENGKAELENALSLAFLDDVLPQGTPISPLITNVMMIPVDFTLTKSLRNYEKQSYVYTRYADDFTISSKYDFDVHKIEGLIVEILTSFHAPLSVNQKKTRYGSSSGKNWNLGLMLNKDNVITVGHKRKAQFQSMLHNFIADSKSNRPWAVDEIQYVLGIYSYIHSIEPETTDRMIAHVNQSHGGVDVISTLKKAL